MKTYKCALCGAPLTTDINSAVCTCDYCGTSQPLQKLRANGSLSAEKKSPVSLNLTEAENAILSGKYKKAVDYCKKHLDYEPQCAEAVFMLTWALYKSNEKYNGVEQLEELSPDFTETEIRFIQSYGIKPSIMFYLEIKALRRIETLCVNYPAVFKFTIETEDKWCHSLIPYVIAEIKSHKILEVLLKTGGDPNSYSICNDYKIFALHTAISADSPEMVKLLLEAGTDPNIFSTCNGEPYSPPVCYAVKRRNPEIVKLLIKHGADINLCEEWDGKKHTALYYAMDAPSSNRKEHSINYTTNDIETVRILLEAGADPNEIFTHIGNRYEGHIPHLLFSRTSHMINCAVLNNSPEMVKMLLEHGADPNSYSTDNKQGSSIYFSHTKKHSALMDAMLIVKNPEIVKLLLDAGADANKTEDIDMGHGYIETRSMLTYAILYDSIEMIKMLLEHGATWDNTITYNHITKVERKFPYKKLLSLRGRKSLFKELKKLGWKGSLF